MMILILFVNSATIFISDSDSDCGSRHSCRAYIDFLLLFAYSFVIFRIFQIILLLQPGAYAFLLACEICTCTLVHGVMYEERTARANSSSRVLAVVLRIFLIESYTRL